MIRRADEKSAWLFLCANGRRKTGMERTWLKKKGEESAFFLVLKRSVLFPDGILKVG